ncbi:unnamed protein product [Zymoseptoria tritici ST99CH_1A5]|uniref:Tyrosinase copper-binding domain-containing protein n=3 Tax=Zymoseptoria tritici TaxID=1047171 RepID=F9XCV9_ZYMTI|nr:uncharacterized protein MYCGRDRAFT_43919 [Zymoseptoria tritici IPO323]EGP86379.1 hypothetical protein MYCGRDRAFT_43919 [Zymoseptoria tritici IPO323]SMQ51546.1 unnamed protein product [Zymoseptoria tritici ST99CH_3D7]SMR56005.1 unnamed protein product [Zymoseptoria tritici ST99CH_3D1]SMY25185.1 unnamed protein product [Zymoseptoria tritici ST99CH_1A5]
MIATSSSRTSSRKAQYWFPVLILALTCLGTGFLAGEFIQDHNLLARLNLDALATSQCTAPSFRREWRSLSSEEKIAYTDGVKCMLSRGSKHEQNASAGIYHDFTRIHATHAKAVHGAAAFLPWHRYMLHLFEAEMRTTCGYKGSLVYWDWTLDWEALQDAPVFTEQLGFGGDGNAAAHESVGDGNCVTDGAFANLTLFFHSLGEKEHCLSRSFADGKIRGRMAGDQLRPQAIEGILLQPNYESFLDSIVKGPHNQIPNGIGGDFLTFTAPNDPLWHLHHSQLDRLWWLWQQATHPPRLGSYGGAKRKGSLDKANLKDVISVGATLGPDVEVADLMSTSSSLLCYRYL